MSWWEHLKECRVKEDHHMFWALVHGLRVEVPRTPLAKAYVEDKMAMTKEKYKALKDLDREIDATISKVLILQQETQEGRCLVWFRGQTCVQFDVFIGSERGCSGMRVQEQAQHSARGIALPIISVHS